MPPILQILNETDCNRASVFIIRFLDDAEDEQDFQDPGEYERLSAWFKNDPISNRMKRGDVLHNVSMGDYRNDGKFIFDGEKLCYPYDDTFADYPDEYGYVPHQFLVINEFPVRYWSEIIDHNSYIYANLEDITQLTWHTPFNDNRLYLGTFIPPANAAMSGLHAIISDTTEVLGGIQLYSYSYSNSISKAVAKMNLNPEHVIIKVGSGLLSDDDAFTCDDKI